MHPEEVRDKRFSVIGGARSGVAVAKLLRAHEAQVFLSDKAPAEKMADTIAELKRYGVGYEFGGNTSKSLDADVMILSPGVPTDIPIVREASSRGLKIVGEVEVASWFCVAPIMAVTGTNGKTTTTSLLGRMFADAKRSAVVAGNIGKAFSEVLGDLNADSTAILEISSFQLDTIESFRPGVAVWLNVTPDHLDRYHHSFDQYIASKCRVFENQGEGDVLVYNYDDAIVRERVHALVGPLVTQLPFSVKAELVSGAWVKNNEITLRIGNNATTLIRTNEISIRGQHNLYNAMAASLAARSMGIPAASIRATLKNFKGVEHRLEFVRDVKGVSYVNDSKATNVDSVWYALQSFDRPIVVILGGRDKGNDYSTLHELVQRNVRAIVAIGESADKVAQSFTGLKPIVKADSMEAAVLASQRLAAPGDVVLLSPACASFDWFENYEHRGRVFKELVAKL